MAGAGGLLLKLVTFCGQGMLVEVQVAAHPRSSDRVVPSRTFGSLYTVALMGVVWAV